MGHFLSNSWSLALIFCTHAKKNVTFSLSKFGGYIQHILFFMIFGSQNIGTIIKSRGQQWHEPARRLSDTLMKIELERGERRVECLCEIGRELYAEERHVHITKIVKS